MHVGKGSSLDEAVKEEICKAGSGNSDLVRYPVKTLIDNTESQEESIKLIKEVFKDLKIQKAASYQLMTFKDHLNEIGHYNLTTSYEVWLRQMNNIETSGGGEVKEGLFLGKF